MAGSLLYCDERVPRSDYEEVPEVIGAQRDRAIIEDDRVVRNMLDLEPYYSTGRFCYANQEEIQIYMRKIVLDWMLDVCLDAESRADVFLLAVNILDRFLGTIQLRKKQFQLLGASALFLASKMMDHSPIPASTLVKYTADTYDVQELLSMELLILSQLKWDLTAITATDYLDYLLNELKEVQNPEGIRSRTERFIALCATDDVFMSSPPSLMAVASLLYSLKSFPSPKDSFTILQHLTRIKTNELNTCIQNIEHLLQKGIEDSSSIIPGPSSTSTPKRHSYDYKKREEEETSDRENDNKTPTEVFEVSALLVS